LVVDCVEVARLLVSYILEEDGYGVRAVHDFRQARYEIKRRRYDAVLMNSSAQGSAAVILRCHPDGMTCEPAPVSSSEWNDGTDCANLWQPVAWLQKPYEASLFLCALRAVLHEPVLRPRLFAGR
jgi:CheY-like chemotaxis protein